MSSINSFLKNKQDKFNHSIIFKFDNKTATIADQEEALKEPWAAYNFALLKIPGTDIEKCQEAACKYKWYAYWFARDIPEANIEYCRKACENDEYWKNKFDKEFPKKQSE